MAFVADHRTTYFPELGQDIPCLYNAIFRGKMSGLFTPKILCKQRGDVDKVVFPYGYIFTSHRAAICSFYGFVDTNLAMATAGVLTLLKWFIKEVQPFSAAHILANMKSSAVHEYALKVKGSSISGNYA